VTTPVRVYVNGRGLDVPPGSSALDAVRAFDDAVAAQLADGTRALVDSRGLPVAPDTPVHGGAIYRIVSARATAGGGGSGE
jgi:hypothetical protein